MDMKISNLKATVAKVFTVGLLGAAVAIAAPSKADAQVAFGVRVGGPVYARGYYAPRPYVAPYGYGYAPRHFYYDRWHRGYWR
jgi:hypothetical protein